MSKSSSRAPQTGPLQTERERRLQLSIPGLVAVSATLLVAPGLIALAVAVLIMFVTKTPWTADSPLPLIVAIAWVGEMSVSAFGVVAGIVDRVQSGSRVSQACAQICGAILLVLVVLFGVQLIWAAAKG